MTWQIGAAVNAVIALAGMLILWSLRRTYRSIIHGARVFEDMRQRERQALELNDAVLQGMVVAKLALELDEVHRARVALESSIDSASKIITDLLGPASSDDRRTLLRQDAATLGVQTAAAMETP